MRAGGHIRNRVPPVGVRDDPEAQRLDEDLGGRYGLAVGRIDHSAVDGAGGLARRGTCSESSQQHHRSQHMRES